MRGWIELTHIERTGRQENIVRELVNVSQILSVFEMNGDTYISTRGADDVVVMFSPVEDFKTIKQMITESGG